jgi:mRNA-degrading endonuclease RelE of RelBE toxin-antitoxin system
VKHRRTPRFVKAFKALPSSIKAQARKAFLLFQENMSHPSLAIAYRSPAGKRIEGYPGVWSGRISQKYRWTFHFEEDPETGERICVHRVIGEHEDIYRKP